MDDWYTDLKRRMKEAQAPPPPPPEQEPPPEPVYREPEPRQASPQQPSLGFDLPTQRDAPPPPEPVHRPREAEPVWQGKAPKSQGGVSHLREYLTRSQRGLDREKQAATMPPGEERDALKAGGSIEAEGRSTYLPEAFGQPYDLQRTKQGRRQQPAPLPEFGEAQFPPEQYPPQPPPTPQFPERGWMKEHWQNERQPPPVEAQHAQQPQQTPPDVVSDRERIEEDAIAPPVPPQGSTTQDDMKQFLARRTAYWTEQLGDPRAARDHAREDVRQLTATLHADEDLPTAGQTAQPIVPNTPREPYSPMESGPIPSLAAPPQDSPQAPPPPQGGPEPVPGLGQLRHAPQGGALSPTFQQAMQPSQPAPQMGPGDVVSHVLNTVAQKYLATTGGMIKDIGITAQMMNETFAKNGGDLDDYSTYKIGTAIENYAKLHFPEDKRAQGSFLLETVPRAFGAVLAYMQAGVGSLNRTIASSAILPALTTGAELQQDAQAHGADQTTQATAMMLGQVLGATNAIPWGAALSAIDKASGGTFKKAVIGGSVSAATNWVTSMVQSGALNQIAQTFWDENRELFTAAGFEGANASAVVGAVIGTAMGIAQTRSKMEQDPFRVDDQAPANKKLSDQPIVAAEPKMPVPSVLKSKNLTSDLSGAPPTPKPTGVPGDQAPPETATQAPPAPPAEAPPPVETRPPVEPQASSVPRGEPQVPLTGTEPEVPLKGTPPPEIARAPEPEPVVPDDGPLFVTPRDRQLASAGQPIPRATGPQNQTLDQLLSPPAPHQVANIQPVPMEGNPKPENIREITKRAKDGFDIPVRFGNTPKGAGGFYDPSTGGIRVKYQGDLGATAHEFAHGLDDKLGIIKQWAGQQQQSPFDNELKPFWSGGRASQPPDGLAPAQQLKYHRQEGVAEWFRSYMINPQETARRTPDFTAYIHSVLPKEGIAAMNQIGADVRAFVNASAHDVMMANVEWKPPKSNLLSLHGDPDTFQMTVYDKWKREVTDDLHPFIKATQFAKRVGEHTVLADNDPEIGVRLLNGGHAKMDDTVEFGIARPNTASTDPTFRRTGPFKDVVPSGADKTEITDKMQKVTTYMLAQRSVEKVGQLGHEIMSWGAGIEPSADIVKRRLDEHRRLPPAERAEIEHYADKYREWADANLQNLVETGRMSPKLYQAIKDSNQYYVAMQRLSEINPDEPIIGAHSASGGGEVGVKREVVHKMTGSNKQIHNPYDSLLESTYRIQRESDRNEVMRDFVDLLDVPRPMHDKDPVRQLAQIGEKLLLKPGERPNTMDNTITVFRKGEPEYWQLQPDVFDALTRTKELEYVAPGLSTLPARIMRNTIVNSPAFQVRNFTRDMPQRAVVSTVGSNPLASFPALKDLAGDRFLPEGWKPPSVRGTRAIEQGGLAQHGGAQAGYFYKDRQSYHKVMERAIRESAHDQRFLLLDPARMGNAVKDFMQTGEAAGRLAEYRAVYDDAIKKGMDPYTAEVKAAAEARGILDFAHTGRATRVINQFIPFTSAGVRGVSRAIQAFHDNPKLASTQWALYVLTPVLANRAWNYMMGDNDELQKEPAYRKDMFMNWKLGADHWLSYPMPFELGVAASGVGRGLDVAFGGQDWTHAYEGYLGSAVKSMIPLDEAAFASIPLIPGLQETISNWDNFRGRHIVPTYEENLDIVDDHGTKLDLRKGMKGASRLGKGISDGLIKAGVVIDPRNVDHFIKRQFGYAGLYAEGLSDIGREDKKGMTALQVLGMGTADPVGANPDVQYIHKRAAGRGVREGAHGDGFQLKQIHDLEDQYRESKDPETRDRIAADLRMKAKDLRSRWEEVAPHTNPRSGKSFALPDAGLVP